MLQIISGRFFKSQDRYRTPKKAILYSNLSWIGQIETSVAVLEPVHVHQEIASYVLSFIVQIEKRPIPSLVCAGEDEVVNQFRLFCMLGLGGYFAPEQAEVEYVCRTSSRHSGDKFVPRQFVPWFFDKRRALKKSDTESCLRLI